jgi:hypothetical protein
LTSVTLAMPSISASDGSYSSMMNPRSALPSVSVADWTFAFPVERA